MEGAGPAQVGRAWDHLGERGFWTLPWAAHPSSRFHQSSHQPGPAWVLLACFHQSCWQRGQSPGKTEKPECRQPPTEASGGGRAYVRAVKARSKPASRPRPVIPEQIPRGTGARSASEPCWQPVVLHHYL